MKNTFIILFTILSGFIYGQEDYLIEMNKAWEDYTEAYLNQDFQKVTSLSHPAVVEKSGGSSYFIDDLLMDQGMFESAGLKVISLNAKQPSTIISAGDELHAMLPYERIFKSGTDQIVEQHFALAASQDQGQSWTFFDLSKQDEESIKLYLPHYDERLNVYLKK